MLNVQNSGIKNVKMVTYVQSVGNCKPMKLAYILVLLNCKGIGVLFKSCS